MKLSYLLKENKIILYTNPEYFGADVPDDYLERSRTPVPVSSLYGYEPDDKMADIHHANDVLKLALHFKKGGSVPPIVVRKTVKGYQVLDGHHRMHAARKAGLDQLDAVIVDRGDIEYSDEVKTEGKFSKAAGAAALAGACIAGTPGCAAVDTKDTLRTVQTVGRTAQTVRDMGRAGAEEELRNILRDKLRNIKNEDERVPRKKGQPAGSKKHSDLYTDENPRGTIQGLKFATVADAEASVNKIKRSGRSHAHKIQAAVAMEQRARAADKISAADVYRRYINSMKKKTQAKANEQTTNFQYSPGKRLTDFPTVGNIYGKKDLDKAATPARLQKKPIKKNPSIYAESASGYIPTAKEKNDPRFKTALTVDVRPGETQRQAAKLGMKIDKAGNPPLLHKSAAKNTSANKAYNLDLTERLWAKYQALKEGRLEEQELVEISQTPGAIRDWAASEAAQGVIAGFEAEVIMPNIGSMEDNDDAEPDWGEDRRPSSIDDVIEFFKYDEFGLEISDREARILKDSLRNDYLEWMDSTILDEFNFDQFKQVCEDEGWYQDLVNEEIDELNDDRDEIAQEIFNKDYDDLSDDDQSDVNRDIADRAEEQAFQRLQGMYSGDSGFYSDALDVYRQQRYDDRDLDEESWFDIDETTMMNIADQQGLSWPYVSGTAGDPDAWENLGQDLQDTLGREVRVSSGYHSLGRGNYYIMEPDSSISPDSSDDAGVEIVSPPMPLKQAQSQLSQLIGWLKANEAYTNESTGLHMGISLPDANIDYTKLVLFTGDKYMLDQFDRAYNTYAKSALDKLVDQVQYSKKSEGSFSKIDIAEAMKLIRKGLANLAGDIVRGRVGNDKYTSIHIKSGYIEFRIAGGNWIDKAEQAELAMLRFARAYTIAADQDAERREYLQKLYKLVGAENPVENLWAQYQAGTISAEQLKDAWANQVLGIDPDAGKQDPFGDRTYQVRMKDTGDVVGKLYARDEQEAQDAFQNYLRNYPEEMHKDYVLVDPAKITKPVQGRKADVAKRLQQRTRIFRFELTKPETASLSARGAALEGVRQALREQETQTFLVPAQDEQSARKKLLYYADWITPRSASRATVAQVLPAKAETMPKEPEYANKDFAFQFNLKAGGGAGADAGYLQTVKISAPNRASAVEELANKVKKSYGVMTRIENLKQVDPNSVKNGELQDEPEEQTYEVEVKIQSGDNIDYKLFDVKARNEYLALSKAEEAVRRNNQNSVLTAKIVNRT